jgi:hypothetical protein
MARSPSMSGRNRHSPRERSPPFGAGSATGGATECVLSEVTSWGRARFARRSRRQEGGGPRRCLSQRREGDEEERPGEHCRNTTPQETYRRKSRAGRCGNRPRDGGGAGARGPADRHPPRLRGRPHEAAAPVRTSTSADVRTGRARMFGVRRPRRRRPRGKGGAFVARSPTRRSARPCSSPTPGPNPPIPRSSSRPETRIRFA